NSAAGTTFQTRTLKWQGALGPAGTGSVKRDATTRYQLVAKHSGMCLSVTGGSTVEHSATSQQPCSAAELNEQFTLEERGAAYVRLRPVHDPGKCLNVSGGLGDDGRPIISSSCTAGQVNESWEMRYHSGFTSVPGVPQAGDIVVQLLSNMSGKCIGISAVSMAAGAAAIQWGCNGSADQYFYLRPLPPAPTGTSPVASWNMNGTGGTLADGTGRGATATVSGGGTQGSGVLTLNGTTGHATTGGPVLDTSKSFTVAGWMKPTALNSWYQTLVAQEGSQYSAFYLQMMPSGSWHFSIINNANSTSWQFAEVIAPTPAQMGVWTHLTGVYNAANATITLYINGAAVGTAAAPTGVSVSGTMILGAATSLGRVDFVNGAIDDIRAYDRPLTATQVGALYTAGRA
ncbi:LamG-like jellyroll fold domain-containing protein, partial [Catellatospora methionotrophica]